MTSHVDVLRLQPQPGEEVDARLESRRHDDRLALENPTAGELHARQSVVDNRQSGRGVLDNGDVACGELLEFVVAQHSRIMEQHSYIGAELPKEQRLMHRHRVGRENDDRLVADFPAVAIRAMQHISTPAVGDARHVRQPVDKPSGDEQPPALHGLAVCEGDFEPAVDRRCCRHAS